jgi:hypothetical protein
LPLPQLEPVSEKTVLFTDTSHHIISESIFYFCGEDETIDCCEMICLQNLIKLLELSSQRLFLYQYLLKIIGGDLYRG